MGTSLELRDANFSILKKDKEAAFEALRRLLDHPEKMSGAWFIAGKEGRFFAFTDLEKMKKASTLEQMMEAWRWPAEVDPAGNIIGISFEGEKYGDDDILFKTLAPFVASGSYLHVVVEYDEHWKWTFREGTFVELEGEVIFRDA